MSDPGRAKVVEENGYAVVHVIKRWLTGKARPYAQAEALYRRYHAVMRRRCRRLLRDEALVDDAMQESFWAMCRGFERFQGDESQVLAWIYRVTTTHCLKVIQREKRWCQLADAAFEEGVFASGVVFGARQMEARVVLQEVLEKLPPQQQEATLYWLINGMTQEEIAEVMGVTRYQVRQWLASFAQKARGWMGLEEVS